MLVILSLHSLVASKPQGLAAQQRLADEISSLLKISSLTEHVFFHQEIVLFLLNRHLVTVIHSVVFARAHYCILQLQTKQGKHQGLQPIVLSFKAITDSKYNRFKTKCHGQKSIIVRNLSYCFPLSIMHLSQENANRTFYFTKNDHVSQVERICSFKVSYDISFENCFQL